MDFEDLIQEEDLLPITTPDNQEDTQQDVTQDDSDPTVETSSSTNADTNTNTEDDSSLEEKDEIAESYFNFLKEYNVLDLPDDFEFTGKPEELEKALQVTRENIQNKIAETL